MFIKIRFGSAQSFVEKSKLALTLNINGSQLSLMFLIEGPNQKAGSESLGWNQSNSSKFNIH